MQAPVRFHGKICHIQKTEMGELLAGVDLEGSGHSDFKQDSIQRYRSLVKMLSG
jgi:hypothetical protein